MFGSIGGAQGIGGPLHNSIGGEDFIRHIGNDKLIYDFKEGSGTTVYDKSHNGNNGTFGAGAAAPTWKRNGLYFDGGDYVDLTGYSHGISTGGFTICSNSDNVTDDVYYFDQHVIRFEFGAYLSNLPMTLYITVENDISDIGVNNIKPISFQITRDKSGNLECYVNGKSGNKGVSDTGDVTYNGVSSVKLGSNFGGSGHFLTGTMYSFRILNKGLSGIECQQEYLVNKFSN